MTEQVRVTIVNHVAIDIAVLPAAVWQAILDEYVEAKKFREIAKVEPIDDRSAPLGGYRMRIEHAGVVDERVIRFTELDDAARRLSIFADYLTVPAGGMKVWVTYQAQEVASGARFAIDCHTRVGIESPTSAAKADIAAAINEMKTTFDTALMAYLERFKAKLECAD